jgi:hypothetical protein
MRCLLFVFIVCLFVLFAVCCLKGVYLAWGVRLFVACCVCFVAYGSVFVV